jgi:hypothetical protein
MPQSHLQSQAGVVMHESIMESILRQCYVPGSSRYNTGTLGFTSASYIRLNHLTHFRSRDGRGEQTVRHVDCIFPISKISAFALERQDTVTLEL